MTEAKEFTIRTGEITRGRIMERTGELRWFAELPQMPPRLQEAWRDRETGQIEWKQIPLVIGKYEQD